MHSILTVLKQVSTPELALGVRQHVAKSLRLSEPGMKPFSDWLTQASCDSVLVGETSQTIADNLDASKDGRSDSLFPASVGAIGWTFCVNVIVLSRIWDQPIQETSEPPRLKFSVDRVNPFVESRPTIILYFRCDVQGAFGRGHYEPIIFYKKTHQEDSNMGSFDLSVFEERSLNGEQMVVVKSLRDVIAKSG